MALRLRSVLAKKTQLPTTALPCKLRVLKYPRPPRETTNKLLSLLSHHDTWDMNIQKDLDALHIKLGYRAVLEVIKSLSSLDVAVNFFHWAGKQKDFQHNTKTYSALVRLAGEAGDFKLMLSLIQQMHAEGCRPTVYFFADVIMALGKQDMLEKALFVFEEMENAGCPPNQFVYNCMISILTRGGYLEGAKKVLNLMCNKKDCLPDTVTYNMLIDKYGKSGDVSQAEHLCVEMRQKGIKTNEKSFASLLGSLNKARKFDKAFELFNAIKRNTRLVNRVTYTELIKGLGQAGQIDKALQVFGEMEDYKCTLDVVVYNVMVDVLVKRQRLTEAWKLFVSMQAKQCLPNVVTYNSLLAGFCAAQRVDEALRWYDWMKQDGIEPDNHTHAILVGGLCKLGHCDAACAFVMDKKNTRVWDKIEENVEWEVHVGEMIMSVAVHNVILGAFVKTGQLERAYAHLKFMEEKGCSPDIYSYTIIIHGLGKAKRAKDAYSMFVKLKKLNIRPNLITFTTVIDVLGKAGMVFEVHEVVHQMTALGLKPDVVTYTSLLPILGKDTKGFQRPNPNVVKIRFDHVLGIPDINR